MRKHNFGYFVSEGMHGIVSHGFMSFAAIGIITACLLIMGSFALVAVNLERNLGELEQENQFLAYIDDSYTREEALALEDEIKAVPNVAEVGFITKEEAWESYLEDVDNRELYEGMPASTLRDRYAIHVTDIEQLGATSSQVEQIDGVAKVRASLEIAQGFITMRNVATAIAVILIAILLVVSLFIISNTIKLATFGRREEIAIMKMCGATNAFVRWPFVYEGIVLGLAGALLAFLLQWGIYGLILQAVEGSGQVQFLVLLPFRAIALRVLGIFVATGLVVGVGGSTITIHKFLQV